ncbi:MAG: hypothetical protein MK116_02785 [Phycisphaerales bacterium]|nr:hypothetical protein [Phycisphaerales bacterium]
MTAVRTCIGAMVIAIIGILSPVASAQTSIEIPAEIRKHVPKDAFLLVYAPSMQKLLNAVSGTGASINPQFGMMVQMAPQMMSMDMFQHETGAPVQLDMDAPAAVAVATGPTGPMGNPAITIMVGVKSDRTGLKTSMPNGRVVPIEGSSLVMVTDVPASMPMGASDTLLQNVPAGDISISFDQATFVKQYGPMIDMMMAMAGGMGGPGQDPQAQAMQAQLKQAMAQIKTLMGMFQSWDMAMTFNGKFVETTVRWVLTNPADKATGSADLAKYTGVMMPKSAMSAAMSKSMLECMMSMQEGFQSPNLPAATQDAMKKIFDLARVTMGVIDSSMGMSMGIDKTGLWCLQMMNVSDPEAYLKDTNEALTALSDAGLGFEVSNLKLVDASGTGYALKIDAEKMMSSFGVPAMGKQEMAMIESVVKAMMGGDVGLQIRYLHQGDKMAIVIGRYGQAIGRAKQILSGRYDGDPNTLDALISTSEGSPTMVMMMDMRQMIGDVLSFLHTVPALQADKDFMREIPDGTPAGDPVLFDAKCTSMSKGGQCVINMNIGDFAGMMEAMDDALRAKKRQQAAMAN